MTKLYAISLFQWLAVGPGHGTWEAKVLDSLKDQRPDVSFDEIVAMEPNPSTFERLKHSVEKVACSVSYNKCSDMQ